MSRKIGDNPWGLTVREETIMDAMCTYCSTKKAASVVCASVKAVEGIVKRVRRKMKLDPAGGRLEHFLIWDRFRRPRGEQ